MIDKRPKTPREVAAFSLFSMAEEGAWSDGALHHYLSRAGLDGRDAALAARLTYGTVQNELLLDWYLRRFSSLRLKKIAPRVLACLRMGLYQLILMDKIPAHAAVAETVSLVRHYCHANDRTVSFANAVMRKAAEAVEKNALPRLDCPDKESYYALRYSHPEWLVRLLSEQFGQKLTERICQADNADTPVSVRVNRMKTTPDEAKAELERAGMTVTPHRAFADILLCTGGDAAAEAILTTDLAKKQVAVQFELSGKTCTLGGIAKGYIADQVAALVRGRCSGAMLNFGGNVYAVGTKPDGSAYRVGVQDPDDPNNSSPIGAFSLIDPSAVTSGPIGVVSVIDRSVVTSGIYERGFTIDGVRYHHILSPWTGLPSDSDLASATIIAESSMDADALATACIVLGSEKALQLTQENGYPALMILRDGTVMMNDLMKQWGYTSLR